MTVGGVAAPVYSVSNVNGREQVNFQVPSALAGRTTAAVVVTRDGRPARRRKFHSSDVQPGLYTSDGTQAIVVHNADYTLATSARPLEPAEYAFLYVSGLGQVANAPADGAAGPVSPLAGIGRRAGDTRRHALRGSVCGFGAGVCRSVPGELPRAGGSGQRTARCRGHRKRRRVPGGARVRYGSTSAGRDLFLFLRRWRPAGGGRSPGRLAVFTTSPNLMVERPSYFL